MATQEEINFEPTATPNFPMQPGRWAVVWMEDLVEVPAGAHAYQVPFKIWPSEEALQEKAEDVADLAEAAHPGCPDLKVVVSRGSGMWTGHAAVHAEGSL